MVPPYAPPPHALTAYTVRGSSEFRLVYRCFGTKSKTITRCFGTKSKTSTVFLNTFVRSGGFRSSPVCRIRSSTSHENHDLRSRRFALGSFRRTVSFRFRRELEPPVSSRLASSRHGAAGAPSPVAPLARPAAPGGGSGGSGSRSGAPWPGGSGSGVRGAVQRFESH